VQAKAARTKLALAMETLETRTRERARWSDLASREMASRDRADQADVLWRQAKSAHADAVGTWDSVAAVASEVQASVDLARANRDQTALELQRCVVRAPFAGFVAERFVEVGDFVRRGTPVVRLVAHERVRLRVHVNAEDALTITRGAAVSIILPGIANLPHYANGSSGEQALSGRVAGVSASADPRTRKFAVDVVADNALGLLREGMFARVQIDAGRLDEAILVPDEATGADEDGQFVFVIEDGKAHRRRVVLGPRQGEGRILRDGLGGPAELVTDGLGQVFDGAPIRRIGN
jgi:RND family efflux transporter MFP subunit